MVNLFNFHSDVGGPSINVYSPILGSTLTVGTGIEYYHFQWMTQPAAEGMDGHSSSGKTTIKRQEKLIRLEPLRLIVIVSEMERKILNFFTY